MATATTEAVRLPPKHADTEDLPRESRSCLQRMGVMFAALCRRYGNVLTVNLPLFGQAVVISDPILV